jgi:hypothetical protein
VITLILSGFGRFAGGPVEHALSIKKSPARGNAEPARRADDAPAAVATGPRHAQPGLALAARGSGKVRTTQVAPSTQAGPTGAAAERISVLGKIGQTKVAASAWSQGHLGGNYGITLPEALRISIDVKQAEGNWVPTVTDLDGRYSIQARVLPHQADVPNAAVATALNYQAIIAALDSLGEPGGTHNHYSLKAVQMHESRHATRVLQALENTKARIETDVAATAIPESAAPDKGTAKTQIEASPAFLAVADSSAPLVATNAYNAWFHELLRLVQNDHDTHGPCEAAEESITKPLKQAIEERAVSQRWVAAKPQVTLPVGTVKAGPPVPVGNGAPLGPKPQITLPVGTVKKVWPPTL